MKWRKITEEEAREVISNPERLEDTIHGRKNAFKTIKDRLLKVTYKDDREKLVIITAISKGR